MAAEKAKKIETFRDKYFSTVVYEYRGHKYEVTYANGHNICCTPAYIQHRDAQAGIDKIVDNPQSIDEQHQISMDEQLDEIWEMMGW